ncbi:MAG: ribose-phosphate pyrophosphokinae [Pseudonocardia sp.]|nr:ribose-phosphate pyrophosphokinae [Pseudonocardia sp.]MDT7614947.1 ribose-phosphate pyrophosphokinae [Pseudonocardiales bacterium]
MREITMFSGSAHPELAAAICRHLEVPLAPSRVTRFANDCLEVQLLANCRERDVFVVQPLVPPVQENLVELLLMLDAARGASAARITVVMPHFAYARSDKKNAPRISIGARLVADLLRTAGADRVLTMTLHSPQVHGFFSMPVDHLHALHELAVHFRGRVDGAPRSVRPWTCPTAWSSRRTWATPRRRPASRGCSACRSRPRPRSGSPTTRS